MYYIINQTHQIIAADSSLLKLLSVEDINELYAKMALGDIQFSVPENEAVTITTLKGEESYHAQSSILSGVLGDMTLVQMAVSEESDVAAPAEEPMEELLTIGTMEEDIGILETTPSKEVDIEHNATEELSLLNDESVTYNDTLTELPEKESDITPPAEEEIGILETPSEEIEIEHDATEEFSLLNDESVSFNNTPTELPEKENEPEEAISLLDNENIHVEETKETIEISETKKDDELFDLILPNSPEETIDEISTLKPEIQEEETGEKDNTPIFIDVADISQQIGISTEDYNNFLNEYIDTALTLEEELQSNQREKRSHAISTLSHLSAVLHLPMITEIITQIKNQPVEEQESNVRSLYNTLSRLTTSKIGTDEKISMPLPETETVSEVPPTEGFGTISLDDVKPIHFDFQLEEAANDLSLPVELIEEFVHDFIEQAHTETKKMLEAYEKGDLETIQKIGHLLKGAASNLRINALSNTLYAIQFCEDSSKLEDLIKEYWGHFLSLETQINLTSK